MHEVIRLFPEIIQYFEYNGENFYIESATGNDEHFGILLSTKLHLRIGLDVRNAEVYEDPYKIVEQIEKRSKISGLTISTSNRVGSAIK